MHFDVTILQTAPELICEAVLDWALCTYYVDPVIVSVIVLVAVAGGIFVFIRKKKRAKRDPT